MLSLIDWDPRICGHYFTRRIVNSILSILNEFAFYRDETLLKFKLLFPLFPIPNVFHLPNLKTVYPVLRRQKHNTFVHCLTLSRTSPGFLRVCRASLLKTQREKKKLLVLSTHFENILPFSSNMKLLSAKSSVWKSLMRKICQMRKG